MLLIRLRDGHRGTWRAFRALFERVLLALVAGGGINIPVTSPGRDGVEDTPRTARRQMTIDRSALMEFNVPHAREILEQTPSTLRSLLGRLSDAWVTPNEGPDTWSAYDILGHLISGERVDWITRTRTILEFGETRTFEPFDRIGFLAESRGKTLTQLLEEFGDLRIRNLETLDTLGLDNGKLERRGTHPDFGTVTLRQLLAAWVVHDLSHIGQIVRVMAHQYRDAVGPWKAYLPVLTRRTGE